ncbi:23S rRNA (guanosine(2251)-2'-O)-methyltransferase RlmB [PVC group bacterium (ex Bugula neritina AB1)]|nr:23S rRNA (guanosine(2251)-2'-O)-methyltransferase RlmB [PVC group bacterium (ex Bugula neritina AB1)]
MLYLYGKNSVRERLLQNPKSIQEVWVRKQFDTKDILHLLNTHNIFYHICADKDVGKYVPGKKHQGIVAKVEGFEYACLDKILESKNLPILIFLDQVQDPQNLGNIMRTLACFGNIVLCVTKQRSCAVNQTVLHVASGAENHVQVVLVHNMINTFIKIKQKGYWTCGTVIEQGESLNSIDLPFPLAIALGSEGGGLGPAIKKYLDFLITIPMNGANLSFNVSNATAILAYESIKQKQIKEK